MNKQNQPIYKQPFVWAITAAVVLIVGWFVCLQFNKPASSGSSNGVVGVTPQASPSPSSSSSSGSKTPTPTPSTPSKFSPTPTPTPVNGIVVNIDTITPRADGTLLVANNVLGATSGSCILDLTGPTHLTFNGTIEIGGSYYFCSFSGINGVTQSGTWTAKLTATSGSTSGSDTQEFTK